jgi:hypothetical protein
MLDLSATLLLDFTLTGMLSGDVIPAPDFGLLWTQVVVSVIVALIFVIATKGRLGFAAKGKTESETSALQAANP